MNKLFLALFVLSLSSPNLYSQSMEEKAIPIEKYWVQKHNGNLAAEMKGYLKALKVTNYEASDEVPCPQVKIPIKDASKYGIPTQEKSWGGTDTLGSIGRVEAEGKVFIIADYPGQGEYPYPTCNVYLKTRAGFELLFHTTNAEFLTIGKNSPVFLVVGSQYGDGFDTTLYTLKKDNPSGENTISLYGRKTLKVDLYLKNELRMYIWQEGSVGYKNFGPDGVVVLKSTAEMPGEVTTLIAKKLHEDESDVAGDLTGPWGNLVSLYKWNGSKFETLGTYYDR
jgi:hypothetical protein